MEANEAMKAMARRIVAQFVTCPAHVLEGKGDDWPEVKSALAAIMETQARADEVREALIDARACLVDHLKYMKEPASARIIKRIDAILAKQGGEVD